MTQALLHHGVCLFIASTAPGVQAAAARAVLLEQALRLELGPPALLFTSAAAVEKALRRVGSTASLTPGSSGEVLNACRRVASTAPDGALPLIADLAALLGHEDGDQASGEAIEQVLTTLGRDGVLHGYVYGEALDALPTGALEATLGARTRDPELRRQLVQGLRGGTSLSAQERVRILTMPLSDRQVMELIRIFEEERRRFVELSEGHRFKLNELEMASGLDWLRIVWAEGPLPGFTASSPLDDAMPRGNR